MKTLKDLSLEEFSKYGWLTPNQRRDDLVEYFAAHEMLDTSILHQLKTLSIKETERRKQNVLYQKCERCYGYFDKVVEKQKCLCDKCELEVHIYQFKI